MAAVPPQGPSGTDGGYAFDLADFLSRLNIGHRRDTHEGRERFRLDHCPFNAEHGFGEAAIFRDPAGVLGFKCMHDSCSDKRWKDVRKLIDGTRESGLSHTPGADEAEKRWRRKLGLADK